MKSKKKVLLVKDYLEPIQIALNKTIKDSGMINMDLLMEYSKILLESNVYSNNTSCFISSMLNMGIIAKGIGGLYDKAVLVIHSEDEGSYSEFINIVGDFSGEIISNVYNGKDV